MISDINISRYTEKNVNFETIIYLCIKQYSTANGPIQPQRHDPRLLRRAAGDGMVSRSNHAGSAHRRSGSTPTLGRVRHAGIPLGQAPAEPRLSQG